MAVVVLSLGIPLLTGAARSTLQILGGEVLAIALRPLGWNLLRWLLAVAFLPYEAYISFDAVLTTLYRLLISHHDLLQWTTAAQTARVFGLTSPPEYCLAKNRRIFDPGIDSRRRGTVRL